jgi:outer membrane protein assembly factor BamE (lipoprotein component of BamABCDE complex)
MRSGAVILGTIILGGLLGACSAREDYRGYAFDDAKLHQIKPGAQTQNEIAQLLGSPSSIATFKEHNDTWYYIAKETQTVAFWSPETKNQKVVAIDFDDKGRVKEVRNYVMKDGRAISPVARETPTSGHEYGFFEQLFGNIGRFTGGGSGPTAPGVPGGS